MSPTKFIMLTSEMLESGYKVRFVASGHSMSPTIRDGDLVTVEPLSARLRRRDVYLYQRDGRPIVHRLIGTHPKGNLIMRGDACRRDDSPVSQAQLLGRVISIERGGRYISLIDRRAEARYWFSRGFAVCRSSVSQLASPLAAVLAALMVILLLPFQTHAQCATPGKDGVGGTLTGIVNTYYPGLSATAAAGSTSVTLGSATGASVNITPGDLLLIIQMQGANINSSNNSRYGDGVNGGDASGVTALNNTGLYEYIVATNTVPLAGGTLNFTGTGTGGGLINTYTNANFGSSGQRRYQIVRVPQYLSATLSSSLTCAYWNGSTGGILAIDVAGILTLGGTVSVDGRGFRGGGGRRLTGGSGSNTDYVTLATNNANGSKGEGIAGTPRYVYNQSAGTLVDTGVEGYPNGSYARGAPGNAGGGGTDGQPSTNDQNSGGGGGANCGTGGRGGNTWNSNLARGGFGGTGIAVSATRIIMGGGGGAGTTNNGTSDPNTNTTGINSSGAAGGGIVMIRAGVVSGTGTITANGANALHVANDGGGGGGAGGTILVVANSSLSGLTVIANGGNGGNAWITQAPGGSPGNRHGPGGGGSGGVILLSSAPAASSTTGGANGRTTTANDPYNSTSGSSSGCVLTTVTFAAIPGIRAGVQCTADVSVNKTASPNPVNQGSTLTYTITVTNNGLDTATGVSMTDPLPSGVTFSSVSTTQGTCSFIPNTVSCTIGTLSSGSSATVTIQVIAGSPTIITNSASVTNTVLDPTSSNNSSSVDTTIAYPTAVQMRSSMAVIVDGRAYIRWLTGREVNNLGFHLYREVNGKRQQITNSLIAGSALMVGPYTPIAAGPSYGFIDDLSGNAEIASGTVAINYWLEQVDLDGKRSWYGPIPAIPTNQIPSSFRISPKLADFGSDEHEQRYFADLSAFNTPAYTPATPAQILTQYNIAAQSAVKLAVRKSGWYRVKQADLLAAGMTVADPRRLKLYIDGKEQPIKVFDEGDGWFDADDYIEFYGSGQDTASTDSRIYWLVVGTTNGLRIRDIASPPRGLSSDTSFPLTVERRDRQIYFAALKNGDAENFFGPIVSTSPLNQTLTLRKLDTSKPSAVLEVSLQGVSDNPNNPADHRVRILLNGSLVGDLVFDGQTLKTAKFNIPANRLREGGNTVTLSAVSGGDVDVSLVNYLRITYMHTFVADDDYLDMVVPAGRTIRVNGFSSDDVRVVDITNPELPQEIIGTVDTANSTSAVSFFVPATGIRRLVAFTSNSTSVPASIKLNKPSSWNMRSNTADIIMLSHESFIDSLAQLKAARMAQGRVSAVVDVEDVYDEFSFGAKSPQAIRDFLLVARTWARAPKFLLLVGDASVDPRNYLGFGETDFVPTKTIETEFMETASDDWFADFNNDNLADIAVGRLSCRTLDEARLIVSKIISFEQMVRSSPVGSWRDQALMIADKDDVFGFTKSTIDLSSRLPANFSKVMVLLNNTDANSARQQIINAINSGKLLVNYFGHGSVEVWTRSSLFTSDDSQVLTNGSKLPFFVMMNCLNGFFHDLFTESLAESLQRAPQGGAVAVWASSGLSKAGEQSVMNNQLYQELFSTPTVTIGEAVMRAKKVVKDKDLQKSWILFGDPAMRLR